MSGRNRRGQPYTRATEVLVTRPDGTTDRQAAYNAAEYQTVVANRKPRKVSQIITRKQQH